MSLLANITVLISLLLGDARAMDAQNSEAKLSAYRREVLENYSKGNFVKPDITHTGKHVLVLSMDPAFDCSDILEFICACTFFPCSKIIAVTCLWHPEEKAKVVQAVAEIMKRTNIEIVIGTGSCHGEEDQFLKRYTAWPPSFGDPMHKNPALPENTDPETLARVAPHFGGIYAQQLDAFVPFLSKTKETHDRPKDLAAHVRDTVKDLGDDYVIDMLTTGPTSDIPRILKDADLAAHVRSLASMGGGFGSFGAEARLGYNFIIDPRGTQEMIDLIRQYNIPTLVVTSAVCAQLELKPEHFKALIDAPNKTPLGEAVCNSWINWQKNFKVTLTRQKKEPRIDYNLADLLTFSLSQIYGNYVESAQRGYHKLFPEKAEAGTHHMLSDPSIVKELFETVLDETSPIFYVTKLKDPSILYGKLMDLIRNKFLYNQDYDSSKL